MRLSRWIAASRIPNLNHECEHIFGIAAEEVLGHIGQYVLPRGSEILLNQSGRSG